MNSKLAKHLQEDEVNVSEDSERSAEQEAEVEDWSASVHVQANDASSAVPEDSHSSDLRSSSSSGNCTEAAGTLVNVEGRNSLCGEKGKTNTFQSRDDSESKEALRREQMTRKLSHQQQLLNKRHRRQRISMSESVTYSMTRLLLLRSRDRDVWLAVTGGWKKDRWKKEWKKDRRMDGWTD
uniref:Uncharacterized protein n=1 Tax=Setaria digitata TaxID=48799 RepID=A0A915PEG9_9BILA